MAIVSAAQIPTLTQLYKSNKLKPAPAGANPPSTAIGPQTIPAPSQALNGRVGLYRGDITKLGVDAIVNAANNSLLGGGGVDGAIHRAAGPSLLSECLMLDGCDTGSAKITSAYALPCKRVIHAVGPIYSRGQPESSEEKLGGAYKKSLELAAEYGCRSVAFSCLSTGIYGYPSKDAAAVALSAIRKFLEEDTEEKVKLVVIVTFVSKDVDAYDKALPLFFPPTPDASGTAPSAEKET
ncbi:hypothetical protein B0T25DRAFT_222694 [Lasiosphaeria hispida]|uniref:Macro domain-containing protein n=1 Tax=Lasiosphaeria hispida TaxID=260671 RepID=A0AAJ0MEX9_9PEZI|nr:hypothetical protein B0T25DRAFT_222694 [Lasiosphaeria hispida]